MTFYGLGTAIGASGGPVSNFRAFDDRWLGIRILAGRIARALPAGCDARLLLVEGLCRA